MSKKYNDKHYARYGDPRSSQWLLMDNQMYVFVLAALYLIVTKWILPQLMRKRNPYQLHKLTISYNLGMMLLNGWVFYELGSLTWFKPNFNRLCQSVDWSDSEEAIRVAEIGWIFLITTILEKFTTVLIALRSKNSHISIIHVFLRIQALILAWYGLKFAPGGYSALYCLLTTFVYSLAHFHYAGVTMFPFANHPYWQRITFPALYMMQFAIVFIYYTQLHFFPPKNCKLSLFILRLSISSAILFFVFAKGFFVSKVKTRSNTSSSKFSEQLQKKN